MRKSKQIRGTKSIVAIIDGKDEKWYLEIVKNHYPNPAMRSALIKPETPQKKNVDELFSLAKQRVTYGAKQVILIIDMDNIVKDHNEFDKFRSYYDRYTRSQQGEMSDREKDKYGWMSKLELIVNNPCIEFWYLLHYYKTDRYYADFLAMRSTLRKQPGLEEYNKGEDYYKKSPNIYERLGKDVGIQKARDNAEEFKLDTVKEKGTSEMYKFFDIFEKQE